MAEKTLIPLIEQTNIASEIAQDAMKNKQANGGNSIKTTTTKDYEISHIISKNVENEWDAITNYQELLTVLSEVNDVEGIAIVREIVADEENHSGNLQKLFRKYTQIAPALD